ncbi:uncharacterized protein DMAD_01785 [Drosophila madeirensis]|uniref:Uncharacterized protein n=1 Tax=Drosophila madeirensis TaxID=30013 RepID=A0AAU9G192_DROMD
MDATIAGASGASGGAITMPHSASAVYPPNDVRAYAMASLAAALDMQQQQSQQRDATDEEVELYASFNMGPSTSRVAAQMQAAKEARRKRWAADGASGSSGDGACPSGSSSSGRRY